MKKAFSFFPSGLKQKFYQFKINTLLSGVTQNVTLIVEKKPALLFHWLEAHEATSFPVGFSRQLQKPKSNKEPSTRRRVFFPTISNVKVRVKISGISFGFPFLGMETHLTIHF